MQCKVCGAPSGKYPLCRACNLKKEKGQVIKCNQCNQWHFVNVPCPASSPVSPHTFLYDTKNKLLSNSEQNFYRAILSAVPEGFCVFPQINLATFIRRTDNVRFHNELFRNVDFLITDAAFLPKLVVEINDQTHHSPERKERDEKVQKICEEAGIPILKLWTNYGVNVDYIRGRILDILNHLPVERVHHFSQAPTPPPEISPAMPPLQQPAKTQKGCYIATAVYGSYDCPEVWTLRRFRDNTLCATWYGRAFIKIYYAISPTLVKWFGHAKWFIALWRNNLNPMIAKLQARGVESTPYQDKM